ELGAEGFAVMSYLLLGGGSFVDAAGRTRTWSATRVPMRVCINPPKHYSSDGPLGYDATLLVATGRQPLTVTSSALVRLGLTTSVPVDRLALVGHTLGGAVQDPGPCGELKRTRCLESRDTFIGTQFCDRLVLTDPDSWD